MPCPLDSSHTASDAYGLWKTQIHSARERERGSHGNLEAMASNLIAIASILIERERERRKRSKHFRLERIWDGGQVSLA